MKVRRVVVAVDTADRTGRIVRAAVRVASRFEAEIEGLFVEDEELLSLAGHSFARWTSTCASTRALDRADLEREWRALAASVRATLEREAAAGRVASRFAVQRGSSREALRERLAGGDVVVVGWGGWPSAGNGAAPIRVLYDDSEGARGAFEVGVRLAGDERELVVWIPGADEAAVRATREALTGRVRSLRVEPIAGPSVAAVQRALLARPGGLLVVPSESEVAQKLASRAVEARFAADVLVVH